MILPTISARSVLAVNALLDNILRYRHEARAIIVYIAIDLPLDLRKVVEATRPLVRHGLRVRIIDQKSRTTMAERLQLKNHTRSIYDLLVNPGYATARNAATLAAIAEGCHYAVHLDDDIYAWSVERDQAGIPRWRPVDFLTIHSVKLKDGTQVVAGEYCGHRSPLVDITSIAPRAVVTKLQMLLSLGNDVLSMNCLSKGSEFIWSDAPAPKQSSPNGRSRLPTIFGGNLGMNLDSVRRGSLPPFYCPRGARGEDTFFRLMIAEDVAVGSAEVSLFHDPFDLHPELASGNPPLHPRTAVSPTLANMRRLRKAVYGWISYAPLWLSTTTDSSADPAPYRNTIATLMKGYAEIGPQVARLLGGPNPYDHLNKAVAALPAHQKALAEAPDLWHRVIERVLQVPELALSTVDPSAPTATTSSGSTPTLQPLQPIHDGRLHSPRKDIALAREVPATDEIQGLE